MSQEVSRFAIPTYEPDTQVCDWGRPHELIMRVETGLRVILGPDKNGVPDLLIERTPDGWQVFVHPNGNDPVCIVTLAAQVDTVMDGCGNVLLKEQHE